MDPITMFTLNYLKEYFDEVEISNLVVRVEDQKIHYSFLNGSNYPFEGVLELPEGLVP